jgi:hypothetical protein
MFTLKEKKIFHVLNEKEWGMEVHLPAFVNSAVGGGQSKLSGCKKEICICIKIWSLVITQ